MELKRELGLFSTTLYGIGIILGAGIYALIGVGAGIAGNALWLAFLFSAVIAVFTGMSYAELSSMFPRAAAEYHYTKKAFGRETFSFAIGWILAIGTVVAASVVSLGFAGYFSHLFGGEIPLIAVCLIAMMSFLNFLGIRDSAKFNNFASVIEACGLLIVVAVWLLFPPENPSDIFILPDAGFGGIIAAVGVIFFAYIGFENVANLAEEVKDSRRTIPIALLLALAISTILYILVAIAAISEVGWVALSQSDAPLTLVVTKGLGEYASILSYIALFATGNTVLVFLIVSSRILYGMSKGRSLPKAFSLTGSQGTPYFAILATGLTASLIALSSDIKTIAQLTDLGVFLAYVAVNAALIALAGSKMKHGFHSPRVLGVPVFAWLGLAASSFMLASFELHIWLYEIIVILAGFLIFFYSKNGPERGTARKARPPSFQKQ